MSAESKPYIYSIEFTVEDIEFFEFPPELPNPEDHDFLVRFYMNPNITLEVTEDEHIDSLNCSGKATKCTMFPMLENQLKCDPKASITAYKIKCPNDIFPCGCYNIPKFHCKMQEIRCKFECQQKAGKGCEPVCDVIKELVPLKTCDDTIAGSIHYTLAIKCFGPRFSYDGEATNITNVCDSPVGADDFGRLNICKAKTEQAAQDCLESCPNDEFDEYSASVNGNSLTVRVSKDQYVTQVYDSTCKKDQLTIRGCDQQIDFNFPRNFTCCQCKKKFGVCKCKGDSDITDYQRKIACAGSSYKNNLTLPVIRGNLKYPGRFEDQGVGFDLQGHADPTDATEKYRVKPQSQRGVCIQADKCAAPGIEVCKVGCEDDVDVFQWRICQKRTSKNGKKHGIVLEMKTPRGPKVEVPKLETREVQVIESEFPALKVPAKKEAAAETGKKASNPKAPAAPKKASAAPKKAPVAGKKAPTAKTGVAPKAAKVPTGPKPCKC